MKRMKAHLLFSLTGILFFSFLSRSFAETSDATLLRLLVDPNRYDRETVRVTGYLHLEPGHDALYLNHADYQHQLYANSLWIDTTDEMRDRQDQLSNHYVVIEGYFDAEDHGDMDVHAGTIKRIKRFDVWSSVEAPVAER